MISSHLWSSTEGNTELFSTLSDLTQIRYKKTLTGHRVNLVQQLTSPQNLGSWALADNSLASQQKSVLLKQQVLQAWAQKWQSEPCWVTQQQTAHCFGSYKYCSSRVRATWLQVIKLIRLYWALLWLVPNGAAKQVPLGWNETKWRQWMQKTDRSSDLHVPWLSWT